MYSRDGSSCLLCSALAAALAITLAIGSLVVSRAMVDEGPTLKRFRPRAQGRASRILKRTSHITLVVQPADEAPAAPAARKQASKKSGGSR